MAVEFSLLEEKRNNFYRDSYRKLLNILIFLLWLGVGLSVVLSYMLYSPKRHQYFATSSSGDIIPLHSLSEPVITNDYLLKWAQLVSLNVLNLSFGKAQQQLQTQKSKFTDQGWAALQKSIKDNDFITNLNQGKLIASAVVNKPAQILVRRVIQGRYTWVVQVPVLVNFTSSSQNSKKQMMVSLTIMRIPVLGSPEGIQVNSISIAPVFAGGA
jgi:intracellular multiplication protein IcmL